MTRRRRRPPPGCRSKSTCHCSHVRPPELFYEPPEDNAAFRIIARADMFTSAKDCGRRSALLQYADELGEPIRVGAQRFGFAIIDDPSFVQDHGTGRERQCDAAVLLDEDDRKPALRLQL